MSAYPLWVLVGVVFGAAATTITSFGLLFALVGVGLVIGLVARTREPRDAAQGAGVAFVVWLVSAPGFFVLIDWLGTA